MRTTFAAVAATILLTAGVQAAIIYVDADFGTNTTLADGTAMVNVGASAASLTPLPQEYYSPGDATIGAGAQFNWGVRDRGDTNGPNVIVAGEDAQNGAVTDVPVIRTTATGLANGQYTVYAYYRRDIWAPQAGLSEGSLIGGSGADTVAVAGDFADTTGMQFGGGLPLTQMALGTATVSDGTLSVFIDDNGAASTARVWYEGIGYEAVPEPSTSLLASLAGLALLGRRRR